jgi:hypothetical protein
MQLPTTIAIRNPALIRSIAQEQSERGDATPTQTLISVLAEHRAARGIVRRKAKVKR